MGTCPPSFPILAIHLKPLHLCSVMLRMMSLIVAMHLRELCTEGRGDSWGDERSSLLLVVMLLLLVVVDVVVVLDVLVFIVLLNMQIIKDGGGTGHRSADVVPRRPS